MSDDFLNHPSVYAPPIDDQQLRERVARCLRYAYTPNSPFPWTDKRGGGHPTIKLDWNTAGKLLERVQTEALEWDFHIDVMWCEAAWVRWRQIDGSERQEPLTVHNVILACCEILEDAQEKPAKEAG